jgi:hypothetical protein
LPVIGVLLGELNVIPIDLVDRADMQAVRANDFHVFLDVHFSLLVENSLIARGALEFLKGDTKNAYFIEP